MAVNNQYNFQMLRVIALLMAAAGEDPVITLTDSDKAFIKSVLRHE
jgi:hypothetical protein